MDTAILDYVNTLKTHQIYIYQDGTVKIDKHVTTNGYARWVTISRGKPLREAVAEVMLRQQLPDDGNPKTIGKMLINGQEVGAA